MKYLVAIGAFLFCLIGVVAIVLVISGGFMLWIGARIGEFPTLYWQCVPPCAAALGLLSGWHSYRATLRRYGSATHR